MEPSNKQVLDTIDDDRLDITSLKCTIINVETYILSGVDELGRNTVNKNYTIK